MKTTNKTILCALASQDGKFDRFKHVTQEDYEELLECEITYLLRLLADCQKYLTYKSGLTIEITRVLRSYNYYDKIR